MQYYYHIRKAGSPATNIARASAKAFLGGSRLQRHRPWLSWLQSRAAEPLWQKATRKGKGFKREFHVSRDKISEYLRQVYVLTLDPSVAESLNNMKLHWIEIQDVVCTQSNDFGDLGPVLAMKWTLIWMWILWRECRGMMKLSWLGKCSAKAAQRDRIAWRLGGWDLIQALQSLLPRVGKDCGMFPEQQCDFYILILHNTSVAKLQKTRSQILQWRTYMGSFHNDWQWPGWSTGVRRLPFGRKCWVDQAAWKVRR